ncbi:MAG: ABC transporter ATP-binding protein [Acholeplasmatales bacterium]|nr:ABC transporter ATP-binding protein [Acholeplasmatales bacterium]
MITGKYINKFYKKYFWHFFFGIAFLVVIDIFQLFIPEIVGKLIDGVKDASIFNNVHLITRYFIELLAIALIMLVGRFAWRYLFYGAATRVETDLRMDLFQKSLKLSNQFYKEHKIGGIMALFTNDLEVIKDVFGDGFLFLVDAIFLGVLSFVKMIMVNWILAIISLIPLTIMMICALILSKLLENRFKEKQEAYDSLSDFTEENFTGIHVIKAFVKEVVEVNEFKKVNQNNYKKEIAHIKLATMLDILLEGFIMLILATMIGIGAYFVVSEKEYFGTTFTIGRMFEFIGYFDTLIWPFFAIALLLRMRAQAKASYKRIEEFLDSRVDIVDNDIDNIDTIRGKIEFKNLSFRYPDSDINTLNNISFVINPGESVGIVGKTGSGKTTLVDLLLRIYNINENELLIDDKDIMHLPFKMVRDNIGYVIQDNFIFSDTIEKNIAFAYDEVDFSKVEAASKMADLDTNIKGFANTYQTILGERGVTLSGGQRQRLSIARALLKDPKILILDDSMSAVDTKTEADILNNLKSIRSGKTTIMIAHRISTVCNLDKIIVMDNEMISGIGTHEELLKNNSIYQELHHLQKLESDINGGDISE